MSDPILELRDVKTHFPVTQGFIFKRHLGTVKAVDGVNLTLGRGEVLGLVGESGCGKSTLARTIMRLVPTTAGSVVLEGKNLTGADADTARELGRKMQMVFQDPYASLNPRLTIYATLAEPLLVHRMCPPADVPARVAELMEVVGLAPRFMQKYPHEFSGGQRQRIAIARALALQPRIIIADEPVSALDVSIQAQILNLLAELGRKMNHSLIFIAHDLSVVKHISDRIAVMYLGKIVELGPAAVLRFSERRAGFACGMVMRHSASSSCSQSGAPAPSLPNTSPSPSAYETSQKLRPVFVVSSQSRRGACGLARNAVQSACSCTSSDFQ